LLAPQKLYFPTISLLCNSLIIMRDDFLGP
jgi:hypothetical protein